MYALFVLVRLKSLALMSKVSDIMVYSWGIHRPTVISETLPKAWAQMRKPQNMHMQTFMIFLNYTVPRFRISYKHTPPWVGACLIHTFRMTHETMIIDACLIRSIVVYSLLVCISQPWYLIVVKYTWSLRYFWHTHLYIAAGKFVPATAGGSSEHWCSGVRTAKFVIWGTNEESEVKDISQRDSVCIFKTMLGLHLTSHIPCTPCFKSEKGTFSVEKLFGAQNISYTI